uniref:Reverse transcriptase domain-containing protein n=1 Tax=Ditylenchus dipsaci TaxID=166011 RepID=A0A915DTE4_9BILA
MNIGPHSGNIYRALRSKFSEDELATVSIKDEEKERDTPSKIKDKGDPIPPTSEYLKGGIEQMLIPSSIQWHVHLIEYADDYAVFSIPDCLPGSKIIEDRLDGERDNPGLKLTSPAFKVEEVDQSDIFQTPIVLLKSFAPMTTLIAFMPV